MEMHISEAEEEGREAYMRRNGEVLASLGFDIKEPRRRSIVFSCSSIHEYELTHLYNNA